MASDARLAVNFIGYKTQTVEVGGRTSFNIVLVEEATAVELMSYCREKFEINNNYSAADMRIIAGLRYSIKTRYIDKLYLPDYVFVQDASMELITSLKENNVPGFEVTVSYTRQYHTNLSLIHI